MDRRVECSASTGKGLLEEVKLGAQQTLQGRTECPSQYWKLLCTGTRVGQGIGMVAW